MALYQIEIYDKIYSDAYDDPVVTFYTDHCPSEKEHLRVLIEKGKGYRKFFVQRVEIYFDATENHINEVIQVAAYCTDLGVT